MPRSGRRVRLPIGGVVAEKESDLSVILQAVKDGDRDAQDRLFRVVYDELHRMAHGQMIREKPGQTLQTTALVNEVYLRLADNRPVEWENRRHFFFTAARAMRQILVERHRARSAIKRGGEEEPVTLEDELVPAPERNLDLLALDQALDRLAEQLPQHAEVVSYRYFLGLTVDETAKLLGVSSRTVVSKWQLAKSWLRREIESRPKDETASSDDRVEATKQSSAAGENGKDGDHER